jgi:hypothetical protein
MSDATVAAAYGCTIYQLRKHRKAGRKYCKRCRQWKNAEEYPLGGGPNAKRGRNVAEILTREGKHELD